MASRRTSMNERDMIAESASPAEDQNRLKRKRDDGSAHTRAKRNRYISIACNECKRRKIKCNGENPCQRCGNLSLECLYAPNCCSSFRDSEEFKQMNAHILSLQEQAETLFSNLNGLRHTLEMNISTSQSPYQQHYQLPSEPISQISGQLMLPYQNPNKNPPKRPRFHGPTSSAFNFGVARSSLQTMGITGPGEVMGEGVTTQDVTPMGSPPPPMTDTIHPTKDPMWSLSKDEALRLCRIYEEEMGLMYPVLDIELVIRKASLLYGFMDAAARNGFMRKDLAGADEIDDEETNTLRIVLAIALTTEASGQSDIGKRLFEYVRPHVEAQLLGCADIKGIRMLALSVSADLPRITGLMARLCMEMGLHRREVYDTMFTTDEERASAIRLFWAIYVLDRRWSFGTGMPFAMQDTDIDSQLPKPDDSSPYLTAMISYSNIGSKVWRSVANVDEARTDISKEEIGYLDYQIIQWHRSIPDFLRYTHPSTGQDPAPVSRGIHRLRVLLYLRANQMRILIYRPVLHSVTSIMENKEQAQAVVDVAKDTIRVLTHIDQTSDIYRSQQVCFNYFLVSALAVLFLAVSHAPAQFSDHCRDEFYLALELVRGLSANSYISKRLWKTIKGLKEVGPRLGLIGRPPTVDTNDAHSTAAVAMAGLAGHSVDELALFSNNGAHHLGTSPNGMANDLTSLFEAAGGYGNLLSNGTPTAPQLIDYGLAEGGVGRGQNGGVLGGASGGEDELSRIMRDLF
ncbi:fungal-specific transcription factor-like protein [Cryomyces antarcticus]